MTASAENMYLGAGILYFDRFDKEGNSTGERDLGHCSAFSLSNAVEKITKYSNRQAARRVYKEVIKQIDSTAKTTLDEFDSANLALALLGEEGIITQTAKTGAETSFIGQKDRYFKMDGRDLTNVVLKGNVDNKEKIYVDGADYTVDEVSGRIYIMISGEIVDETALTATYDIPEKTYVKITGASVGKIQGRLRFVGDPTSGPRYEAEFWKVSVAPDGEMALIGGDDFASFSLTVTIEDDSQNHPSDPLYRLIKI